MAELFKQREQESTLPHIERLESIHHSIDSLSRGADHIHIPSEGTYLSSIEANFANVISRNVNALGLESSPLSSRFARILDAAFG
ncbi:hypothetical protein KKB44_01845 [Candidatus Micrarchaeota archaeon]|nr:hypothetical protein [Candidatus Micrarchaeota archaeon]